MPSARLAMAATLCGALLLSSSARCQSKKSAVTMLEKSGSWSGIGAFAFGPNGNYVAGGVGGMFRMAGADREVVLWDRRRGKAVRTMAGHDGAVSALAFTADGKQLVSLAAATGDVRVFDVRRGKLKQRFAVPAVDPEWISVAPKISPDGRRVATFAQETMDIAGKARRIIGALRMWDVQTGKELWRRERTHAETAAFSPDGAWIAYYAQEPNFEVVDGEVEYSPPDSVVRILKASDGAEVKTIDVGWNPIKALAFTHDGKVLVTLNEELRRYGVGNGELIGQPGVRDGASPDRIDVSQDGTRAMASSAMSNDIIVWDLTADPPTFTEQLPIAGAQPPYLMSKDFAVLALEIAGEPALLDLAAKDDRGRGGRRRR